MKMPLNPYIISYSTVFITIANDPYSIKNSDDIHTTCHTFYHTLSLPLLKYVHSTGRLKQTFGALCSENQLAADTI